MGRVSTASGGGKTFKQPDAGTHAARCIGIIDLGTQEGEWQGEPTRRNQVIVRWELPFETEEFDGVTKPLIVSKFYTNSLNEKATLRKDLESWRSKPFTAEEMLKGFDLENIIGKCCQLSIVHTDKGKAKVVGVSAMAKGMTCPAQFNDSVVFWIEPWNDNKFEALPEFYKDLIRRSEEYRELNNVGRGETGYARRIDLPNDDDIPF